MDLSTVFRLSIYLHAACSSAMLGSADGTSIPYALTLPFCVLAWLFVDRLKVLELSTGWANAFGLLALVVAGVEMFGEDVESRLLAGAHLLVYLTWIVLLHAKTARQYWWLCALGVLQVAVGAVLTTAESYGAMLLGYLLLSVWTLSVFSLYQAAGYFSSTTEEGRDSDSGGDEQSQRSSRAAALSTASAASGLLKHSSSRFAVQRDPEQRWVGIRFTLGTLLTAVLALCVTLVFFVAIPRAWIGNRPTIRDRSLGPVALTGFSHEVRLGDFGPILESTEPVFEVRLFDQQSGRELDVEEYALSQGYDEPLFRGAVLDSYRDGRWFASATYGGTSLSRRTPPDSVRQEYRLQPIGTPILFAIHPVVAGNVEGSEQATELDRHSLVLIRPPDAKTSRQIQYFVNSPTTSEKSLTGRPTSSRFRTFSTLRRYRDRPGRRQERLTAAARRIAGYDPGRVANPIPIERSERLLDWLRDSGEFSYSLDTTVEDPAIDKVEDFLFNRKRGHCEYFASALTLMLRAVDVPSRLVNGFKGGGANRVSDGFEVQQRHAHAWVEAWIDGQWIVLDPTPAAGRSESVAGAAPRLPVWHDLRTFASSIWRMFVLDMDIKQQKRELYDPARQTASRLWEDVRKGRVSGVVSELKQLASSPERWFSWEGGAVTFVLLLIVAGGVWAVRRIIRILGWLRGDDDDEAKHAGRRVDFYEQFRKLCEAHGLVRQPAQTQREFANGVLNSLALISASNGMSVPPAEVAESFYTVRFGGEEIPPERRSRIEQCLSELERFLNQRSSTDA